MNPRLIVSALSALLVFLFAYAAVSKLLDFSSFSSVLQHAPYLFKGAGALALLLPFAELGICLLLLIPRTRRWGLVVSLVLLTVLTSYLGFMVLFAPQLPCSCGGIISSLSWKEHIALNGAFLLLNLVALRLESRERGATITAPGDPG